MLGNKAENNTGRVSRKYAFRKIFFRPEGILLLVAFIITPLTSGFLLYGENKASIQDELEQLCHHISYYLDPAQHEKFALLPEIDTELQAELLNDISLIHLSNPKIRYIYTVKEIEDEWYFILDTLQNEDVFKKLSNHVTEDDVSGFKEKYNYPDKFLTDMKTIARGDVHIDKDIYIDEYGKTIGCMIGIIDDGNLVGALGVDYSADQLNDIEVNITRSIAIGGMIGILLLLVAMRYLRQYLQEKQSLLHRLDQLSRIDSLTEISNRRAFFLSCEQLIEKANKGAYKAGAIIDIDWFKKVNDDYGHAAGDAALKHFAKLLNHSCNTSKFIIGRVGGEEFAVFCITKEETDMIEALDSFRSLLSKSPVLLGDLEFKITFSAGYKVSQDKSADINTLLSVADKALYVAKDTGRDRIIESLD